MTTKWINPSDCVDMDCDARRKVLINNDDGTFFGNLRQSVISKSEFGWSGDGYSGAEVWRLGKCVVKHYCILFYIKFESLKLFHQDFLR